MNLLHFFGFSICGSSSLIMFNPHRTSECAVFAKRRMPLDQSTHRVGARTGPPSASPSFDGLGVALMVFGKDKRKRKAPHACGANPRILYFFAIFLNKKMAFFARVWPALMRCFLFARIFTKNHKGNAKYNKRRGPTRWIRSSSHSVDALV